MIDTPAGDWYAFLFQDYGAVGRIPFLVPVEWQDGWPVMGVDGKVPDTLDIPAGAQNVSGVSGSGVSGIVASDDFVRTADQPALPLAWQWNHNPDDRFWSLTERPGFLRLTTGRIDRDFLSARNSLTQRTFGPQCSGTVALDVSQMKNGDVTGLAVLQKKFGLVGVAMENDTKSVVMQSAEDDTPRQLASVPLKQNTVYLHIDCDFRDRTDKAYFYFSLDGQSWAPLGEPLQMAYTLPHFMGYRFALFNFATKTSGGHVDFDYFHIGDEATILPRAF